MLLAGCSTTRLFYDHLDTLLRWKAADYVDLNARQKHQFNAEVAQLWNWHRRKQLPLYAANLRQWADQVQAGPMDLAQVQEAADRIEQHWENLLEQALPGYARLNADLGDAQVADMVARIGKEIDRRSRKRQRHSAEERREDLADEMNDTLHQWIGRPNPQQRERVRQWAAQVQFTTPEQEAERRGNLDRYAAVLATRTQPGFEQRMRGFVLAPQAGETVEGHDAAERARWLQLLSELSATLDAEQREHLRQRLLGYAEDFEALAAEKQPTE